MRMAQVVESVDIEAPRGENFDIMVDRDRRLPLSPLWGVAEIQEVTLDYPQEGGHYAVKQIADGGTHQIIVTGFSPNQSFAH